MVNIDECYFFSMWLEMIYDFLKTKFIVIRFLTFSLAWCRGPVLHLHSDGGGDREE